MNDTKRRSPAPLSRLIAAAMAAAAPSASEPPKAEVEVSHKGVRHGMSADEFLAACGNLSKEWPDWLPCPIDLEDKWVTVYSVGKSWWVDTPLEEQLLGIAAEVRAALGKQPYAPEQQPAQPATKVKRRQICADAHRRRGDARR